MLNLKEEKRLWRKGFKYVVGLDEAGRGGLAGPVVGAAVLTNLSFRIPPKKSLHLSKRQRDLSFLKEIRESKKLTSRKREELFKILTRHPAMKWGTGRVSEKVIDKINILEATKLAMKRAIKNLKKKLKYDKVDFLILDGNFKLPLNIPQKSIIGADQKVLSCAISSIIAKVSRDRIMQRYHKKYPLYGFARHKGYSTKLHLKRLKKYGPCPIHRKSFRPVLKPRSHKFKNILENSGI